MPVELSSWLGWPALAFFIAMPALSAWNRRRGSRAANEVAAALAEYAATVRATARIVPMEDSLRLRVRKLRVVEAAPLLLAQELERAQPAALADAAQRLAIRLRRRVCFERKMLARTAPGLRRGTIAASLPPVASLALHVAGVDLPAGAQLALMLTEAVGCALLYRLARVEI